MLTIVTVPNPVLSKPAPSIKNIDKDVLRLIIEMKKTLAATRDPQGVGLAAPQVSISLRLFIAKPTPKSPFLVFINPKVIHVSRTLQSLKRPKRPALSQSKGSKKPGKLEGCLSLPNIWGPVLRHAQITLAYTDEKGQPHKRLFTDFMATIVQHEMDHLGGILFPKHVLEQKGKLYKSYKNEKNEDEFDLIEL